MPNVRRIFVTAVMTVLLSAGSMTAADNLLNNGGFEEPFSTIADLGDTWMMHSVEALKDAGHFTRDTDNPHSGQACLRMVRPASPQAWSDVLGTPPGNSLNHPKSGMRYTLSFWARTDRPGPSTLRIQSLREVAAKSPGPTVAIHEFALDRAWSRHEVSFIGDWDFRVAEAVCVYPVFLPAVNKKLDQAKTIWIDDVALTEEPAEAHLRVGVDPAKLAISATPLRFQPGSSIQIQVDSSRAIGPVGQAVGGLSISGLSRWSNPLTRAGVYEQPQALEEAVRDLRLPMTRFYGLVDGDLDSNSLEIAIDQAVLLMDRFGIPRQASIIEPEPVHANTRLSVDDWRRLVSYAQHKNLGIRHWEIGNEVWLSVYGREYGGRAFATASDYVRHVIEVSQAVKAIQPDAQIGVSILTGQIQWCDQVLAGAAGHYDFVCPHLYDFAKLDANSFEEVVIAGNHARFAEAQTINAILRACNPQRDVAIYDSEWGLHDDSVMKPWTEARNGNQMGMLYRAVRMIYYARENMVRGASGWVLFSQASDPGFLVIAKNKPEKRSMMYWLYHQFNRHLGERVLEITGTVPFLTSTTGGYPLAPIIATLSKDESQLFVIIANGSKELSYPADLSVAGFESKRSAAKVLRHDNLQADALLERDADFVHDLPLTVAGKRVTFMVPSHSVVFITLSR
jgi:hypothetical protein